MQFQTPLIVDIPVAILWAIALCLTLFKTKDVVERAVVPAMILWILTVVVNALGVLSALPGINWLCLAYVGAGVLALVTLFRAK